MKVRVSFSVEIDAAAWQLEFGLRSDEVREDVQTYVENTTKDNLMNLGMSVDRPMGMLREA